MIRWRYSARYVGGGEWCLRLVRLRADGRRDGLFLPVYVGRWTPQRALREVNAPARHATLADYFNKQQAWAYRAGLTYIARIREEA